MAVFVITGDARRTDVVFLWRRAVDGFQQDQGFLRVSTASKSNLTRVVTDGNATCGCSFIDGFVRVNKRLAPSVRLSLAKNVR